MEEWNDEPADDIVERSKDEFSDSNIVRRRREAEDHLAPVGLGIAVVALGALVLAIATALGKVSALFGGALLLVGAVVAILQFIQLNKALWAYREFIDDLRDAFEWCRGQLEYRHEATADLRAFREQFPISQECIDEMMLARARAISQAHDDPTASQEVVRRLEQDFAAWQARLIRIGRTVPPSWEDCLLPPDEDSLLK